MIASQLEPFFNAALQSRLETPIHVLPRGTPLSLPQETRILVAAPLIGTADAANFPPVPAEPPKGWPFGLEWIQLVSSGIDVYPKWFLEAVPTSTARGVVAHPIAEYVIAAIFDAVKNLPSLWIHHAEDWKVTALPAVRGSTLGIVGYGAIGKVIAQKARALGMHVQVLRQKQSAENGDGVTFVRSIGELLSGANHVVLAAPSSESTRHILNAEALRHARPGLHVINIARGDLVDDDALLDALDRGAVSLATLDTTSPEPLPEGHRFYTHPKVRITPHTSAIGPEARLALVDKLVTNIERFKSGQALLDQLP